LECQIDALEKDASVGLVHTEVHFFDDVTKRTIPRFNPCRSDLLVGDCFEQLALGNGIFNSTVAIRRSVVQQTGGFSTDIRENSVQDYDLWLRCARTTRFQYLPEKLATYRVHPGQAMWDVRTSHAQLAAMLEKAVGAPEKHQAAEYRRRFAQLMIDLGIEHLDAGAISDARACFKRATLLSPNLRSALYACCAQLPLWAVNSVRRTRSRARKFAGHPDSKLPGWTGRINNNVGST
jgi:hypothetical protein